MVILFLYVLLYGCGCNHSLHPRVIESSGFKLCLTPIIVHRETSGLKLGEDGSLNLYSIGGFKA